MAKQTVKPSETTQVPSAEQFSKLVKSVKNVDADIADVQSEKSELIKKAVKNAHLNKDAFGIFQKLARMSDKKLSLTLDHLEHYIRVGGLEERSTRQADMIGHENEKKLAEASVKDVAANGGRKKRKDAKPKTEKKGKVVPFESQREREAAADFGSGVDGEAVH